MHVGSEAQAALEALSKEAPVGKRAGYRLLMGRRIEKAAGHPKHSAPVRPMFPAADRRVLRVAAIGKDPDGAEDVYVFFTLLRPEEFDTTAYDLGRLVVALMRRSELDEYVERNGLEFEY